MAKSTKQAMLCEWSSGDGPKVCSKIEQAKNKMGKPIKAAIIYFEDDSKALVSKREFDGKVPKFLSEETFELDQSEYKIDTINGKPWIVPINSQSDIQF